MGLTRKQYKRQRKSRNQQKRLKQRKQQKRKTKKRGRRVKKRGGAWDGMDFNDNTYPQLGTVKSNFMSSINNSNFDEIFYSFSSGSNFTPEFSTSSFQEVIGNLDDCDGKTLFIAYDTTRVGENSNNKKYMGFHTITKRRGLRVIVFEGTFEGYMKDENNELTKLKDFKLEVNKISIPVIEFNSVTFWRPV